MGRLDFVKQSLPTLQAQPNSRTIFVDYSCPDRAGQWVAQAFPDVHVIWQANQSFFNLSAARNLGAQHVRQDSEELICFIDADVTLSPSFTAWVTENYERGHFMFFRKSQANSGLGGLVVVQARDFHAIGGYDENMAGYGRNAAFMRVKLYFAGLKYLFVADGLAHHMGHDQELSTRHYQEKNWKKSKMRNEKKLHAYIQDREAATGMKLTDDIYRPFTFNAASTRIRVRRRLNKSASRIKHAISVRFNSFVGLKKFKDEDLVFYMQAYKDQDTAADSLARIRKCYPHSRIVLLSDGDRDFPGDDFAQRFNLEYVLDSNLYGMENGGKMVHRMLCAYMRRPARFLVRIDTDGRVDRRFKYLPHKDGLHGCIEGRSGTVQGGCVLLSHKAAEKLFYSEVFLSKTLLDYKNSWGKYSRPENLERNVSKKRVSYDKVLHWGCVEQNIPIHRYFEIFSVWKLKPEDTARLANSNATYAVVHPTK